MYGLTRGRLYPKKMDSNSYMVYDSATHEPVRWAEFMSYENAVLTCMNANRDNRDNYPDEDETFEDNGDF